MESYYNRNYKQLYIDFKLLKNSKSIMTSVYEHISFKEAIESPGNFWSYMLLIVYLIIIHNIYHSNNLYELKISNREILYFFEKFF